jgi:hypothetical protein
MSPAMPRPTRRDPAVVTFAARKLAERICEDWDSAGDVDDWTTMLAKEASDWTDGYRLARELEKWHRIDPDAHLVEVLSEAYFFLEDAHKDALRKWVQITQWTPKFSVGDRVQCRHGVGRVNEIKADTAQYLFAPDADVARYRNGGGIYAWEDEFTPCDSDAGLAEDPEEGLSGEAVAARAEGIAQEVHP